MNFLIEMNDTINNFCIPTIIGIFTFATPLILQAVSRIDDKYDSTLLAKMFIREKISQCFVFIGICSFVSIIFWILKLPRVVDFGSLNLLMENSASLLTLISTLMLIIASCRILYLIYVYYIPIKLANRLQRQYNKNKKDRNYFDAICKVLNFSISKADENLARQTYSTISEMVINLRSEKRGQEITYPDEFYDNIFEANELLLKRERKTLSYLNESSFIILLLDECQMTEMSDKTYHYLWLSLRQAVYHKNKNAIKSYWEKAHQYAMTLSYRKYSMSANEEINKQEKIFKRFEELHYALGGLLLYSKMYDVLNSIMFWTDSQPPRYILVPSTMSEVINMYIQIAQNDNNEHFMYYETRYPFIGVSGVNAGDTIRYYIKYYIAVLFLRQYTLVQYYFNESLLQMPQIPQTMSQKRFLNNQLDYFKSLIDKLIKDQVVLDELGFGELSDEQWFVKNNKEHPDDLINSYKMAVECDIEQSQKEQPISESKVKEFYEATKDVLNPVFKQYKSYFYGKEISEDYNRVIATGSYLILEKEAYADNQGITHANADRITAESAMLDFRHISSCILLYMQTKKYFLRTEDIWSAVNQICANSDGLMILSVGVYLNYYKDKVAELVEKDGEWTYNNIPVVDIYYTGNELVCQSLWIIKKEDIPCLTFNKISEDTVSKYLLKKIDENYNIYASVIDLHSNATIQKELKNNVPDVDKKVLVSVYFNADVRCKKSAKAIQLKIYSQFSDKQQANAVADIDKNFLGI